MHEISLIQNLLESIRQEIKTHNHNTAAIRGISLTIGALELHSPEAFRQAYDIESKDTELEGKSLELKIVPAQVECSACEVSGSLPDEMTDPHNPDLIAECPACGVPCYVKGGRGVQKIELIMDS